MAWSKSPRRPRVAALRFQCPGSSGKPPENVVGSGASLPGRPRGARCASWLARQWAGAADHANILASRQLRSRRRLASMDRAGIERIVMGYAGSRSATSGRSCSANAASIRRGDQRSEAIGGRGCRRPYGGRTRQAAVCRTCSSVARRLRIGDQDRRCSDMRRRSQIFHSSGRSDRWARI